MVTEKAFVDSAQQGVLIAIIFAFMILTIVTCNMLIAFLAILSVGMIMVSVIAVMVYQGWEMGVSESVSVVMLIGLSVDYIVHLAQAYKRSVASHRSAKTKFAFQEMGVSIFSSTITTFLAGVALFGGQIVIFQKFALVICTTILFSFLVSMLFFGALLHIIGPQNDWCDLCSCMIDRDLEAFKKNQQEQYDLMVASPQPLTFYDMQRDGEDGV